MKTILLAFALLFSFCSFAQNNSKPPKLRVYSSVFSTKYELGDKTVKSKDVRLHLEKTSPEAYYKWRKAENASTTALVFSVAGLGAVIYAVTAKESNNQVIGYGAASASFLVSLAAILSSGARQEKAVDIYNNKYGY